MAILHKKGNLSGKVGNSVFRTVGTQTIVQSKPKRVKQTLSSKACALEFGLASATAFSVRHTIAPICAVADKKMVNRLNTTLLKAIRGSSKEIGERDLHDADLSHLNGFQFNANSPLTDVVSVRPESSMPAPGKIRVSVPSFSMKAKQGPREAWAYRLRLLVTAFHFKEKWSQFIGHEDLNISINAPFEGKEWLFDDLPVGCVLIVTVSLQAYTTNYLNERIELNTVQWSPAEIIGAYHILDEKGETLVSSHKERNFSNDAFRDLAYSGKDIFEAFQQLWELHSKPEKPQPKVPETPAQQVYRGRVRLKEK